MIYTREILRGLRCPLEYQDNLDRLLIAANKLRTIWAKPMIVTSGFRTVVHNTAIGGAKNSAHLYCMAIDVADPNGELDAWLDKNPELLEKCGLWKEHSDATPGWCHVDIRERVNRIFKP